MTTTLAGSHRPVVNTSAAREGFDLLPWAKGLALVLEVLDGCKPHYLHRRAREGCYD